MKFYIIFFTFFCCLFFAQIKAKVVGIKDGDTIVVLLSDSSQKVLRLAEVDCPESSQEFGKNAKKFTSQQVFGKYIEFWETDVDRYGRSIAKVFYDDNKYLSEEIIKFGWGWFYFKYSNNKKLEKLHFEAKKNKIGLWQSNNAISPYEFRQSKKIN